MSVTITSNSALSILRLAPSPPLTVSTLWPSRRRAMSRSSQMERSSSQTRILPTRASLPCRYQHVALFQNDGLFVERCQLGAGLGSQSANAQDEGTSFTGLGAGPDF